jgi:hypothetical protein
MRLCLGEFEEGNTLKSSVPPHEGYMFWLWGFQGGFPDNDVATMGTKSVLNPPSYTQRVHIIAALIALGSVHSAVAAMDIPVISCRFPRHSKTFDAGQSEHRCDL